MTDTVSPLQSSLQLSDHLAAIVAATSQSVVAVHGRGRRPSSGLIWQPGLAVAAEETVERDGDLALTLPDGTRVEATLAGRDPSTDIAVLRSRASGAAASAGLASPAVAKDLRPGHFSRSRSGGMGARWRRRSASSRCPGRHGAAARAG